MKKMSRRSMTRLVLGAPVAASLASAAQVAGLFAPRPVTAGEAAAPPAPPAPEGTPSPAAGEAASPEAEEPPLAKFLARQEAGLTSEERRRVRREVAQLEQSLKEVRDYPLLNDVPPSGTFRALKGRRSAR